MSEVKFTNTADELCHSARLYIHSSLLLHFSGMLVDHTGQYSYVFYACSVCVFSASLFLVGFFYFLDSKRDEEEKKSVKTPSDLYQKPVVILAPDCQYVASKGRTSESTVYVTSV